MVSNFGGETKLTAYGTLAGSLLGTYLGYDFSSNLVENSHLIGEAASSLERTIISNPITTQLFGVIGGYRLCSFLGREVSGLAQSIIDFYEWGQ